MIFEIVKSEGIAHKSYFLGSGGSAAVIDPRRDCEIYIDIAEKNNLRIESIFETHRNEDYVIGSLELSDLVGAEIYHGSKLDFDYGTSVEEGNRFQCGSIELEILETPGHTDESISITLKDKSVSDDVYMVFSGDTLFAGEVGRADLYGKAEIKRMAGNLYESIYNKILHLGANVILCPAHGAGSVCGADIRAQELTTIGYEKKTNHVLQKKNKEDFIRYKFDEKLYTPPYFKKMEIYNRKGPKLLCKLPYFKPLCVDEVKEHMESKAQILDVRSPASFAGGHIPQSLNIWKQGVPVFAGWLFNYQYPIIIIDEDSSHLDKIRRYLIRIGYDNLFGYLAGGIALWYNNAEAIETVDIWSVHKLKKHMEDNSLFILDVRKINEWKQGYIKGAHHIYVGHLKERLEEVPKDKHVVVYCDSGKRASVGASILKMNGFKDITIVLGSMKAWKNAGYPITKD